MSPEGPERSGGPPGGGFTPDWVPAATIGGLCSRVFCPWLARCSAILRGQQGKWSGRRNSLALMKNHKSRRFTFLFVLRCLSRTGQRLHSCSYRMVDFFSYLASLGLANAALRRRRPVAPLQFPAKQGRGSGAACHRHSAPAHPPPLRGNVIRPIGRVAARVPTPARRPKGGGPGEACALNDGEGLP